MSLDKFEDTKGVIRSRNSEEDRQRNGEQEKKTKEQNDLQNTTQKNKD